MTTVGFCRACGNNTFTQGKLGNGYTSVTPVDKMFGSSPLIITFCKECGEVASIKVKNPKKF
ncbi:hypothetical protein [Bacillus massiliigorillae]|uniref:hypothetical protein n=1 Tax=Bacillus massiliigorillae TaxID=1243664 RepID=UPI0003A741C2|nr:hypothetical protein [Bacillus massiliigorillae]